MASEVDRFQGLLPGEHMADYFLVLEGSYFVEQWRPGWTAAWQRRSFEPIRSLCEALSPAAREYLQRYHPGAEEPLVCQVAQGLEFDRTFWRTLVGESLMFAAVEIPEFPTDLGVLVCLLAPKHFRLGVQERERLAPIQQALRGSRDLLLGSAIYRPLHAGLNAVDDVARLASYLQGIDPGMWRADDLLDFSGVEDEADRDEELALAREWFPALVDLYARTSGRRGVLVIEQIP